MSWPQLLNPARWFAPRPPRKPPLPITGLATAGIVHPVGTAIQQDLLSGCTGAALRGVLESLALIQGVTPPITPTWEQIWKLGKLSGGNVGASEMSTLRLLQARGVLANWTPIMPNESGAHSALRMLAYQPIAVSCEWRAGMETPWVIENGYGRPLHLCEFKGQANGRHFFYVYGRILDPVWGWLVIGRNSAGRSWGDAGNFAMQEREFANLFSARDTLAFKLEASPAWIAGRVPWTVIE